MGLNDVTREGVLQAIEEFDRLKRAVFLEKYGFGAAYDYFLIVSGKTYDSKAICGAAHGYSTGTPLAASDFSGGKAHAVKRLEELRFEVLQGSRLMTPIVLTENERTHGGNYDHWKDVTGERYQYPNQYKNKVIEGRPFVYYRGSRRADGSRAVPEYFGHGVIGPAQVDPDTTHLSRPSWTCEIADYFPFTSTIPFKKSNGELWELIPQNQFGVAVRNLDPETYSGLLKAAGAASPGTRTTPEDNSTFLLPPLTEVTTSTRANLMVARQTSNKKGEKANAPSHQRRSRFSKMTGDRGEVVVLDHLRRTLPNAEAKTLRWVAADGEKPGWDIEYTDESGALICIEVKATTGRGFPSVELTANEWEAATAQGSRYRLALVAQATSTAPTVEFVDDLSAAIDGGEYVRTPAAWRITRLN